MKSIKITPKSKNQVEQKKCLHFSFQGPKNQIFQVVRKPSREVRWGLGSIQGLLPMPPEPQNIQKTHIFEKTNTTIQNFEILKFQNWDINWKYIFHNTHV